jgi:hypothetical protein
VHLVVDRARGRADFHTRTASATVVLDPAGLTATV